jgi:integrase
VRLSLDDYAALGAAVSKAESAGISWQTIAAVRLLALTGCRRGEIDHLRWNDVDFENMCLRLDDTKTGRSVRPIGSAVTSVLLNLPKPESGFVLPAIRTSNMKSDRQNADRPFCGLPRAWKRVLRFAPETEPALTKLTPHGLRHSFASLANELGYTEPTIAALLGHSQHSITSRYIHHVDKALVAAADHISGKIANAFRISTKNCV